MPAYADPCNRDGKRDPPPGVAHLQLAPKTVEQRACPFAVHQAHDDDLRCLANAEQVKHLGARRAMRHTDEIYQSVTVPVHMQYLFPFAHINDRDNQFYSAVGGHLGLIFTHPPHPPQAR